MTNLEDKKNSHDLRSDLSAIFGGLEMVEQIPQLDPETREIIKLILSKKQRVFNNLDKLTHRS